MTAAVPDPGFRDQLAEDLAQFIASYTRGERAWARMSGTARDIYRGGAQNFVTDALLPLIAAEVEAQVQAATNQRAVEELRAAAEAITNSSAVRLTWWECAELLQGRADDLAAALASPAPAPRAEPTGELREQLTRWAMDRFHLSEVHGLDAADTLLSGPLAPLLAKLRAVEELHAELADERPSDHPLIAALANRLRRALDAEAGR